MADRFEELVIAVAKKLSLLSETGGLLKLDSLNMIDMVVELEQAGGPSIPVETLDPIHFGSIAKLAAMLRGIGEGK